jgi:hypothetical protein
LPVHYSLQEGGAVVAASVSPTAAQAYPSTWHCPLLNRPSHACKQYWLHTLCTTDVAYKRCQRLYQARHDSTCQACYAGRHYPQSYGAVRYYTWTSLS